MIRKELQEWKEMRFGMFIHWGLYALLGRGEWAMYEEAIDKDEYRKLMDSFTAENFDAGKWAAVAKAAGMKYMVLTTRHHDGFALWDSAASHEQFTSMHTPAHRDFVGEFVDACRSAGLKVGLYYSPLDWRFPGYFFPRMYRKSALEMRRQCHEQIRELLTQYGKIDIFWFDGGEDYWLCHGRNLHQDNAGEDFRLHPQCPGFWGAEELNDMIRTLQPGIIVNNRFGNREFGDFETPEKRIGEFNTMTPWETNTPINGTYGWVDRPAASLRNGRWKSSSQCGAETGRNDCSGPGRTVRGDGRVAFFLWRKHLWNGRRPFLQYGIGRNDLEGKYPLCAYSGLENKPDTSSGAGG